MNIIRKIGWFLKLEKKRYIVGILALSLVSVFNLIPSRVIGNVVDNIASGELTNKYLFINLAYLVSAALIMYGLRYVWRVYIFGAAYNLGRLLRFRLFQHFTKMSPSFYQKYRTGDLMAHATNDINSVVMVAGAGVMSAVDASITALVTLGTMVLLISPKLSFIAILPFPFMAYAVNKLGDKNYESFKEAQESFSDLNSKVQENASGVRVTKSFGYGNDEIESFKEINKKVFIKNIIASKYNALFNPMVLVFIGLSYTLTLIFGGIFISNGEMTVGELVTFVTYLDMLVWPLQAIGWLYNIGQRGDVSYGRIEKLLAEESSVKEMAKEGLVAVNGRLEYNISNFVYLDKSVLSEIKFSIEQGQTLGIVGVTGSGKTTLLKLLLREYDVVDGEILLNGENIKNYKLKDLRSLIGYVPQDQVLFAMSIKENIRFADPAYSDERVEEVTKLCGLYNDIKSMPDGIDTIIGERGVSLSGGQKQRIAMSRALIMNPDILILDDSLSAVDAKTENIILENLKEERKGKTTIITAHRLSAIVHADLIIVMDNGKIIERGTHDELLAQDGWYKETYSNQQLEEKLKGGE
ncbi:Probable multidrug resistance ABC transporter ATP-binding/permease protein YheI [Gemella morbillorum]|uniref:ABC transporter ATP-binding protein n=1 Tax=Gemella morbillorum TaxID=29391 RepID=UPI000DA2E391|nr:ABC transporter transmembrane domain-containing protein [Gemella morbillorum]UBH79954.1 ATP-binding cassette domain-containing protein [Gemella morbillorum]SQH55335.1 Probable multidrug resistance ABC transporter ATP-binding/permease protein YheI [Gemella morbillorum]